MKHREYFVYILTNKNKTVLYTGVTNSLGNRLTTHFNNQGKSKTFAGRYNAHHLVYYEVFSSVKIAIDREKEIKKWSRKKKEALILTMNPEWRFLNEDIMPWPPSSRTSAAK